MTLATICRGPLNHQFLCRIWHFHCVTERESLYTRPFYAHSPDLFISHRIHRDLQHQILLLYVPRAIPRDLVPLYLDILIQNLLRVLCSPKKNSLPPESQIINKKTRTCGLKSPIFQTGICNLQSFLALVLPSQWSSFSSTSFKCHFSLCYIPVRMLCGKCCFT